MRTLSFLLIALLSVGAAQTADAQGKRKVKPIKKTAVQVNKVDTVSLADFSYAMGVANTNGLRHYLATQMQVDTAYMADFQKGFEALLHGSATDKAKLLAMSAGMQIAMQVKDRVIPGVDKQITNKDSVSFVNQERLLAGFLAGAMGNSTLSIDSATAIVTKQSEYYQGQQKAMAEQYMLTTAKEKGVKQLPEGVLYRVINPGKGKPLASDTSTVKVNYEGKLITGKVFDSSYQRGTPASFKLSQVIKGWQVALKQMPVGATWEVIIPYELAYGTQGNQGIPPYSPLIFKVELLAVQ